MQPTSPILIGEYTNGSRTLAFFVTIIVALCLLVDTLVEDHRMFIQITIACVFLVNCWMFLRLRGPRFVQIKSGKMIIRNIVIRGKQKIRQVSETEIIIVFNVLYRMRVTGDAGDMREFIRLWDEINEGN